MQTKKQITTDFSVETRFEVQTSQAVRTIEIPELLSLPLEEQRIYANPNLSNRPGIPFSPIHD
jgi:hypothetical protein